ncbi:hypothetical protein DE146DRAFT_606208 [Phaeosphaeria sp. MPI-PUGE-AT-0046c]|nr:hypothetical protein DE146DRAFT_606208 [Phaeosphaeria sp. MPI-PUGE-AT-0046c]
MVAYSAVLASNAQISAHTPNPFVAVFAGATTGIGEATLTTLIKYLTQPRVYLFARNEASAERVIAKCRQINPQGHYTFVKVDLSSIKETDHACDYVKCNEKSVNLVVASAGELTFTVTPEGLNPFTAASTYSRIRIVQQLLPLLTAAASSGALARVLNVAAGTYEGDVQMSDMPAINVPFSKIKPHMASLHTLALESLQEDAPEVSFVHNFPGAVLTDLHKGVPGFFGLVIGIAFPLMYWIFGTWLFVGIEECGERQVYFATSDKYKPLRGRSAGVPRGKEVVADGSEGMAGSGMYSVNWDGEERKKESLTQLRRLRSEGVKEKVWSHFRGEFDRIVGTGK